MRRTGGFAALTFIFGRFTYETIRAFRLGLIMGFFDTYKPAEPIKCPVCSRSVTEWQGKQGPCGLFVWEEGIAHPTGQEAGEVNILKQNREKVRLPEEFEIYSYECGCPFPVEAICKTVDGIWSETIVIDTSNAKQGKQTRGEFKRWMRWLEGEEL